MRFSFAFFLVAACTFKTFPQQLTSSSRKPPLDTSAFGKWESVVGGQISNDGKYVCYVINHTRAGKKVLVIQSVNSLWKKEIFGASLVNFTADSRQAIFMSGRDSLCLLSLGLDRTVFIGGVNSYTIPDNGDGAWLAYSLVRPQKAIVLRNLITSAEDTLPRSDRYEFSPRTRGLLLQSADSVEWLSLSEKKLRLIWTSQIPEEKLSELIFDKLDDQVAFLVKSQQTGQSRYALWRYKEGADTAITLVNDSSLQTQENFVLSHQMPEFSKDGRHIFFGVSPRDLKRGPSVDNVPVDIWSYRDPEVQSVQLAGLRIPENYTAVVNTQDKNIFTVTGENEHIVSFSNEYALVCHELSNYSLFEIHWNKKAQLSFSLVSLKDGSRILLKEGISNVQGGLALSPQGKWIIRYDFQAGHFISYEIGTGINRNITKGVSERWKDNGGQYPVPLLTWVPWRKTWLDNDEAVLVYDNYDIWQIDPSGTMAPIDLTNGYGRRHNIKFELLSEGSPTNNGSLRNRSTMLLKAVDLKNKNWGFYSKRLGTPGDPKLLSMGPYAYGSWSGHESYSYPPVKAKNADRFLVSRMSAVEAPNYFVTDDFKEFTQVSNVQPQNVFNWLTSELIHWQTLDGTYTAGVLYKPENFDPHKKYPVIFEYYEAQSDELNLYRTPAATSYRINIPWFVSNGYLVFTPDIHYRIGSPGQSTYNAVVSAAKYLSRMTWVDSKRMGLQGHSFGGYETNYLITHSCLFAAACETAGVSDLISEYGSDARGTYPMYHAELSQGRIGATPWQRADLYINNSPIFNADKVTTPLLMMHNKGDDVVPFSQGMEFFMALRRLGKRVWLLQYDGSGHVINGDKSALDFTIRVTQFFAHYLKDDPAPTWMTKGIPAALKGIDTGLEPDTEIKKPGPGLNLYPRK